MVVFPPFKETTHHGSWAIYLPSGWVFSSFQSVRNFVSPFFGATKKVNLIGVVRPFLEDSQHSCWICNLLNVRASCWFKTKWRELIWNIVRNRLIKSFRFWFNHYSLKPSHWLFFTSKFEIQDILSLSHGLHPPPAKTIATCEVILSFKSLKTEDSDPCIGGRWRCWKDLLSCVVVFLLFFFSRVFQKVAFFVFLVHHSLGIKNHWFGYPPGN